MMLNKDQIQKLLALSDTELRNKVAEAAIAAGADKFKTSIALSDMKRLRSMISALSEEQINALLTGLGTETANEIAKRIGQ